MRLSSKLALWAFLIVVALLGWAAWYAQDKGFTRQWRELITEEFEKRGIHATIRRLNLDPLRGLIAKDVLLYEDQSHEVLLMSIDKIALDIDITKIFSPRESLRSFEISNARISIPLDPGRKLKGEQLRFDNLSARVMTPPGQIEIVHGSADFHGLNVGLTGSLLRPSRTIDVEEGEEGRTDSPSKGRDEKRGELAMIRERRESIAAVLAQLEQIQYGEDANPQLIIRIDGDLAKMDEVQARGKLKSGALRYASYAAEGVDMEFEYQDERLRVNQLRMRDRHGELKAELELGKPANELKFNFESSLDLHGFLVAALKAPRLHEIVFYKPPRVEVSGTYQLGKPFSWTDMPLDAVGEVRADRLTSRGVIFESLGFDFGAAEGHLYLRNGRIEHKSGVLDWDILRDTNGVRFNSTVQLDPSVFSPFVALEGTRNFLDRWTFDEESAVFVKFDGQGPDLRPTTWSCTGVVDVRNCKLNDHPISQLQCDLDFEGKIHNFRNIVISRPEGAIAGKHVRFDHEAHTCELIDVEGHVFPRHAVGWFAPRAAQKLVVYDFHEPPYLNISGIIDVRKREVLAGLEERPNHQYKLRFESDSTATYPLFGKTLHLIKPSGTVEIKGSTINLTDFQTETLGGQFEADVTLTDIHRELGYQVQLQVTDLDFRQLAETYSSFHDTAGSMTGTAQFQGKGDGVQALSGGGDVTIVNGNVFSIPCFGPLSKPVQARLPKIHDDFSVAREANLRFSVTDGMLKTDNFEAKTNTFQLKGSGSVDLHTQELNCDATLNMRGAVGALLAPVSKFFEFKGEGSVSAPQWSAKNMEMLGKTGGDALKELTDVAGEALKKATEGISELNTERKKQPK